MNFPLFAVRGSNDSNNGEYKNINNNIRTLWIIADGSFLLSISTYSMKKIMWEISMWFDVCKLSSPQKMTLGLNGREYDYAMSTRITKVSIFSFDSRNVWHAIFICCEYGQLRTKGLQLFCLGRIFSFRWTEKTFGRSRKSNQDVCA